ncbi:MULTISPECIES: hypothetical protein [unclassified Pseudomonas]|uniref:hypothetical protein n=1 Tax=unclassified Pseudomonas TaxID=196821 RepID=UPI0011A02134|nr:MULTISPECIES: hypothetical protein [unclassified Pseudomonas]TWC17347.1 hypothetical protein FBY00_10922 [Pseudomonas sp. SJZ075]TWC33896.1 hypothetical protein FBY02_108164 [Pseudomonas sp. SJZ078]TWC54848.1 hypothetical protein FBY11_109164 [Pseudomonas sp. SJZ124]TWC88590.1 hypothetical protein FBY09_10922 [Pseudomonas sp. SJZ101]
MKDSFVALPILAAAILLNSTSAVADPGASYGVQAKNVLSANVINLQKEIEGQSLEHIVSMPSLSGDAERIRRKQLAAERFNQTIGSKYFPDINSFRSYLTRETLETTPAQEYFIYNAAADIVSPELISLDQQSKEILKKSWMDKSRDYLIKKFHDYELVEKQISFGNSWMDDAKKNTRDSGNTSSIFGRILTNSESQTDYKPTALELNIWGDQSEKCRGNKNVGGPPGSALRQNVMSCFEKFETTRFAKMGYSSFSDWGIYYGLNLVTSLVDESGLHKCMASYYSKDVWITAAHCISDSNLYIVSDSSKTKIQKGSSGNVTLCTDHPNCDVAYISAKTFNQDTSQFNAHGNLADITPKTELFVPGIEIDSPILADGLVILKDQLLWSPVGKSYCRYSDVEEGCFSHACSTLTGFSGAPVYVLGKDKKLTLIGVHSGEKIGNVSCKKDGANYAVSSRYFKG